MALVDALLKIEDANGNLKKITIAEEDYLAWQAGYQLSQAGLSKVASLNTSGGTTVGTYNDTSFDGAVGSTTITTTTVSTTLYQINGTAPEDPPFVKPMIWKESAGQIEAADDTELDTIVDRLLLNIFANDYPGTYYLGTSAPDIGYNTVYSPLFTDTRTDGTTVDYNLYRREASFPLPSVVQTLKLEGTNGDLKPMTREELRYTFGQRAKTRIMATGIGTYQLRSSAEGAPTDPGTWVAKGTAVDTRQQTADADYTGTFTNSFTAGYDSTLFYVPDITYARGYVRDTSTYTEFLSNFGGNYTGEGGVFFSAPYQRQITYLQSYTALGTSALYTGNFGAGAYSRLYIGPGPVDYNADYQSPLDFVGNFLAPVGYVDNYQESGYLGPDGGYYGDSFREMGVTEVYGRALYGSNIFPSTLTYSITEYDRNYVPDAYVQYYDGFSSTYERRYLGYDDIYYTGPGFSVDLVYEADGGVLNFVRAYVATYDPPGEFVAVYQGAIDTIGYIGAGAPPVTYESVAYTTNPGTSGVYKDIFIDLYNYHQEIEMIVEGVAGQYITTYTGPVDYVGNYTGNYGNYIVQTTTYTTNYQTQYQLTFIGNYIANYEGNFTGETIQAGSETIETYTLYVRVA